MLGLIGKRGRSKAIVLMGLLGLVSACFRFQNDSLEISATVSPVSLSSDRFDFGLVFLGEEIALPFTVYYSKESGRGDFEYNLAETGGGFLCQFIAEIPLEDSNWIGPSDPSDSWNLLLKAPNHLSAEESYSCDISIEITEQEHPVYTAGAIGFSGNDKSAGEEDKQEDETQKEQPNSHFVPSNVQASVFQLEGVSENQAENSVLIPAGTDNSIKLEPLMLADAEKYLNQRNLYIFIALTVLMSIISYFISRAIRREDQ